MIFLESLENIETKVPGVSTNEAASLQTPAKTTIWRLPDGVTLRWLTMSRAPHETGVKGQESEKISDVCIDTTVSAFGLTGRRRERRRCCGVDRGQVRSAEVSEGGGG